MAKKKGSGATTSSRADSSSTITQKSNAAAPNGGLDGHPKVLAVRQMLMLLCGVVLLASVVIVVLAPSPVDDKAQAGAATRRGTPILDRLRAAADTEGEDGEVPMWTNFDEVFIELDKDRSTTLDMDEFFLTPAHPLIIVPLDKVFLMADKNGDKLVDLTEWFQVFMLFNNVLMKSTTEEEWRIYMFYMQDSVSISISERHCWAGPEICDRTNTTTHPVDTSQRMTKERDVVTVPVGELSAARFYRDFLSQNQPVLIKGGAKHWPAYKKWTDAYLTDKVGTERVNAERSKTNKFGYEDKTWFGSINDTANTAEDKFTWTKFLRLYQATPTKDLDGQPGSHYYVSSNIPKSLAADVELPPVIPCLQDRHEWTTLWMGAGGQNSLLHNDQFDNLYAIVAGTKRVVLFDPDQSPYLYEDKYVLAKGKVSAVNFEDPDYTEHPLARYSRYQEAQVEAGDILYIPLYWWHQVYSPGRSIGVTHWFDMWKKSSLVGSGRGQGSEHLMRTFKAYISQYGAPCPEVHPPPKKGFSLAEWKGCRYAEDRSGCIQVTARHDFCSNSSAVSVREEALVKRLLDLWQASEGQPTPQPSIEEEFTRAEVNRAVGVLAPCQARGGEETRYTEFVEYVGDVLYFQNAQFTAKVKEAVGGKGRALGGVLAGFSREESVRLLMGIYDNRTLGYKESVARIHKLYMPLAQDAQEV